MLYIRMGAVGIACLVLGTVGTSFADRISSTEEPAPSTSAADDLFRILSTTPQDLESFTRGLTLAWPEKPQEAAPPPAEQPATPPAPEAPPATTEPAPAPPASAAPAPTEPPPVTVVPSTQPQADKRVTIKPVAAPAAGEYGHLGISIQAPWMTGPIELRMPEMLSSHLGIHFMDHKRADSTPLSMLNPFPEWKTDAATGDLSYEVTTAEGVVFGGKAHAEPDSVHVEFWVANGTQNTVQNIKAQMCLLMENSPEFGKKNDLANTFTWIGGHPASLAMTTPSSEQKGRPGWIILLTNILMPVYAGPREYPDGAWVVDEPADFNLVARASNDLKYLVGLTWDETASEVMCNSTVPCMHAGPSRSITLQVREKATWRGKVYLIANDTENLLARYSKDAEAWFGQK